MKKTFILDTNVVLNDPTAIFNFKDNNIYLPLTVLEELDNLKKGTNWVNANARLFIRTLNKLIESKKQKISLGKNKGILSFSIDNYPVPYNLPDTSDNRILATCLALKASTKDPVVFVTKDINLRVKAQALDITTQDYENDKVSEIWQSPSHIIINIPEEVLDHIATFETIDPSILSKYISKNLYLNEYYIFTFNSKSIITRYSNNKFIRVKDQDVCGLIHKNLEQTLAINALLDPTIPLIALTGLSGSGKTLLSLAAGIHQKRSYLQIYLARPIVPVGRDIGYIPGTVSEKIDPYMQPLYDNLEVIKKEGKIEKQIEEMLEKEKIKILALPYIRGRSLPRIFFIIDEAQNLTPLEVKTIITRAGEGTKIIFTGDVNQIDTPYLDQRSNGLSYLISKMYGNKLFAHVHFTKGERSELSELASKLL